MNTYDAYHNIAMLSLISLEKKMAPKFIDKISNATIKCLEIYVKKYRYFNDDHINESDYENKLITTLLSLAQFWDFANYKKLLKQYELSDKSIKTTLSHSFKNLEEDIFIRDIEENDVEDMLSIIRNEIIVQLNTHPNHLFTYFELFTQHSLDWLKYEKFMDIFRECHIKSIVACQLPQKEDTDKKIKEIRAEYKRRLGGIFLGSARFENFQQCPESAVQHRIVANLPFEDLKKIVRQHFLRIVFCDLIIVKNNHLSSRYLNISSDKVIVKLRQGKILEVLLKDLNDYLEAYATDVEQGYKENKIKEYLKVNEKFIDYCNSLYQHSVEEISQQWEHALRNVNEYFN